MAESLMPGMELDAFEPTELHLANLTEIPMNLGLQGAAVCVSGGSTGMGYESALLFASEGARVCITGLIQDEIDTAVEEFRKAGSPDAWGLAIDLTKPATITEAYRVIGQRWGALNTLVNMTGATGAPKHTHFADFPEEEWYHSFDIGTLAAMRCTRAALPLLRAAEWGRVVNITSLAARINTPEMVTYGTSKSAMQGLSKTLALTLAPDKILVNSVCPGTFVTGAFRKWMRDWNAEARGFDPNNLVDCFKWIKEDFGGRANAWLGRCAEPSELAPVVVFVGSRANTFMTGADINVDGGTDYWS
jgi:3-oxoacyl-[acyl-carrier protein] reductase